MKNSSDNVFRGIRVGENEPGHVAGFLDGHDFAPNTRKAFRTDLRKFARWFSTANAEPFRIARVAVRDVVDFRNHLRRDQGQAVSTVNRALVALRRFFDWLVANGQPQPESSVLIPVARSVSFEQLIPQ